MNVNNQYQYAFDYSYTRTWSDCTDPYQKPVKCNEKLHMITDEDELLRIAMMYL